jgi:hypothetical protein
MNAELAALRQLTGLQKTNARFQVDGFSRAETALIAQMAQRGIGEVISFSFAGRELDEH